MPRAIGLREPKRQAYGLAERAHTHALCVVESEGVDFFLPQVALEQIAGEATLVGYALVQGRWVRAAAEEREAGGEFGEVYGDFGALGGVGVGARGVETHFHAVRGWVAGFEGGVAVAVGVAVGGGRGFGGGKGVARLGGIFEDHVCYGLAGCDSKKMYLMKRLLVWSLSVSLIESRDTIVGKALVPAP